MHDKNLRKRTCTQKLLKSFNFVFHFSRDVSEKVFVGCSTFMSDATISQVQGTMVTHGPIDNALFGIIRAQKKRLSGPWKRAPLIQEGRVTI